MRGNLSFTRPLEQRTWLDLQVFSRFVCSEPIALGRLGHDQHIRNLRAHGLVQFLSQRVMHFESRASGSRSAAANKARTSRHVKGFRDRRGIARR